MKKFSLLCLFGVMFVFSVAHAQLSDGLQAAYPFAGSVDDMSGHDHHGTIVGSVALTEDRFGSANCAYSFAGDTGSYVMIPYDAAFDYTGGGAISISLWYKGGTSSLGDFECLFGHWTGMPGVMTYTMYLALYDLNKANFCQQVWESTGTPDTAGAAWHHVVGTYNDLSHTFTLYKDNVLVDSIIGPALPASTGNFVIGRAFEGKIDDLVVYNRVLSGAELDTLYNLPSSCATTGMNIPSLSPNKIYPNPTTGFVIIESKEALRDAQVMVQDVMGRMVLRKKLTDSNRNSIDLSDQPNGLYFIRLQNGTEQKTEIIQKIR